ncbi:MAG: glycosyltransferase [Thermofilum sp.]|nr:glycosyltransferase [Thermofilum sp.]
MTIDILIIFPGTLEASTKRGGGREDLLLKVAIALSNTFNVVIIAPFFGKYRKSIKLNPNLIVENLYFPASKEYPYSKNKFSSIFSSFSILLFYQIMALIKTIQLKKNGLRLVILSDICSGIAVAIAAKFLNIKTVYYEGNLTPWTEPYVFTRNNINFVKVIWNTFKVIVGRIICKMVNAVIVNDGLIMSGMVRYGIEEGKIFIIRSGVNTDIFKPIEFNTSSKTEFTVGFIGRLTEEKGAPILLELCKAIADKLPQVKFMIFGDGPYKKYFEALPNVKHLGWVAHNILPKYLSSTNVILSFQKTFGKGEIEALSCGKPIIAFKIGEMPQLIKDGETGLLCLPRIDCVIEAISKLMNDEGLLRKLSENARREAITHYSQKISEQQWKSIIERVLRE